MNVDYRTAEFTATLQPWTALRTVSTTDPTDWAQRVWTYSDGMTREAAWANDVGEWTTYRPFPTTVPAEPSEKGYTSNLVGAMAAADEWFDYHFPAHAVSSHLAEVIESVIRDVDAAMVDVKADKQQVIAVVMAKLENVAADLRRKDR